MGPRGTPAAPDCKPVAIEAPAARHTIVPVAARSRLPYERVHVMRAPMLTPTLWRIAILVATLICVVMLFAPLVREMLSSVTDLGAGLP
jgi:hypothetical protein